MTAQLLPMQPRTRFRAPAEVTAPEPPEQRGLRRDEVRLLVARPTGLSHRRFWQLAEQLRPGDLSAREQRTLSAGHRLTGPGLGSKGP